MQGHNIQGMTLVVVCNYYMTRPNMSAQWTNAALRQICCNICRSDPGHFTTAGSTCDVRTLSCDPLQTFSHLCYMIESIMQLICFVTCVVLVHVTISLFNNSSIEADLHMYIFSDALTSMGLHVSLWNLGRSTSSLGSRLNSVSRKNKLH